MRSVQIRLIEPRQLSRLFVIAAASFTLAACFVGDENHWASRRQIVQAALRCGVPSFQPTKVGDTWAAYVAGENPNHGPKGDCIYADLQRQGLLATR